MSAHIEFLMGLGDQQTSPGIVTMAAEAEKIPGATVVVRRWSEWSEASDALMKTNALRRIIIGYSNGGSEVTQVAARGIPIDLLISLDPTIWLAMAPLQANVKRAICFHNVNPASSFPPVGHASISTTAGFRGVLQTIDTWDQHMNVDTDPIIQQTCLSAIRAAAE